MKQVTVWRTDTYMNTTFFSLTQIKDSAQTLHSKDDSLDIVSRNVIVKGGVIVNKCVL